MKNIEQYEHVAAYTVLYSLVPIKLNVFVQEPHPVAVNELAIRLSVSGTSPHPECAAEAHT